MLRSIMCPSVSVTFVIVWLTLAMHSRDHAHGPSNWGGWATFHEGPNGPARLVSDRTLVAIKRLSC